MEVFDVWYISASNVAFATLRPTTCQAAFMNSASSSAVMLAGVGNISRHAKNQSLRLLWRKRSISGKYKGR
jgi:hypothetical protein